MNYQGNLVIAPDRDRAIYQALQRKAPNNIITPSYLRLEKKLSSGQGTYNFDIGEGVNSPTDTEMRLNLNDAFMATYLGIYLLYVDATIPATHPLTTYPNPKQFPAEVDNVNPAHLEAFYNGYLTVKVGDVQYGSAIATRKFRHVPTTQQTETDPVTILSGETGYDGLMPLTPQFTFQGQAKNVLQLNIATNSTQEVQYKTSNDRIYVVWYMEGFLITGGSNLGSLMQ